MARDKKPQNETPDTTPEPENTTVGDEAQTQTQTNAPASSDPAPASEPEKPKKGKVEVSADSQPDENDETNQRLADARGEAVNNHARQNS